MLDEEERTCRLVLLVSTAALSQPIKRLEIKSAKLGLDGNMATEDWFADVADQLVESTVLLIDGGSRLGD